ncbi:RNA-directed DNA polymerase, partial [Nanoarchaeota archaeon]
MPLGNLTSQFFANVYLNELDQFVKHKLKAKYYIRYVDDFVILHKSKEQLYNWKKEIYKFLKEKLKLELHPDKSQVISLSKGIDFVGFRNFYYFKLLRKRN